MFKNVATKIALFAFDTTTGAPKTGDAANLTAYVAKDYGTVTVLADTSATEMDAANAKGWYLFDVAQGETNADALVFTGKSSTSNVTVVGQHIFTTPNRFTTQVIDAAGLVDANAVKVGPTGAGTAQTARDLGASVLLSPGTGTGQVSLSSGLVTLAPVTHAGAVIPTVSTLTGHTPQTGDNFARLGAPAGASLAADVAAVKVVDDAIKAKTDNLPASPASTTNITAGTITTCTNLTNAPTNGDLTATMKASVTTAATAATPTAAAVTGAVGSVTAAVTVGTNNDKTGYGLSSAAVQAIWDAATSALTTVGSIGKWLLDKLDVTVGSRLPTAFYTAPLDATATQNAAAAALTAYDPPTKAELDAAVAPLATAAALASVATDATNAAADALLTRKLKEAQPILDTASNPLKVSLCLVQKSTGTEGAGFLDGTILRRVYLYNAAGAAITAAALTTSTVGSQRDS